jgi:hypothetical protein
MPCSNGHQNCRQPDYSAQDRAGNHPGNPRPLDEAEQTSQRCPNTGQCHETDGLEENFTRLSDGDAFGVKRQFEPRRGRACDRQARKTAKD